jgi:7-carboxy-7-deazaguanine synthase
MNQTNDKLRVSEVFYSLQGEGARAGSANVFVRLQGCKAKNACYANGIRCDTEFESGREYSLAEVAAAVSVFKCRSIIWTGGEPAQQLTGAIVGFFKDLGFYQAIETSGLLPVPQNLDWITLSPKVAEHVCEKNFPKGVSELRYVRSKDQSIPQPAVSAQHYFVSPHNNGNEVDYDNLRHCIELVKENPQWKLSTQLHKIWSVR